MNRIKISPKESIKIQLPDFIGKNMQTRYFRFNRILCLSQSIEEFVKRLYSEEMDDFVISAKFTLGNDEIVREFSFIEQDGYSTMQIPLWEGWNISIDDLRGKWVLSNWDACYKKKPQSFFHKLFCLKQKVEFAGITDAMFMEVSIIAPPDFEFLLLYPEY